MNFLFITNQADIAQYALNSGADRIFIDLEIEGKQARQGHKDTVINHHQLDDIAAVRKACPKGSLLVRINPWSSNSPAEIEQVIACGADHIMLPMFRTMDEARSFVEIIGDQANPILLIETLDALKLVPELVTLPIKEFYLGLNDLSIDAKLSFLFEPIALGWIEEAADLAKQNHIQFGFGGVARIGQGQLPAELVLSEHLRLGSNAVILSRAFHQNASSVEQLKSLHLAEAINELRQEIQRLEQRSNQDIAQDKQRLDACIRGIAEQIQSTQTKQTAN